LGVLLADADLGPLTRHSRIPYIDVVTAGGEIAAGITVQGDVCCRLCCSPVVLFWDNVFEQTAEICLDESHFGSLVDRN
jgi:hypothetical protein